MEFLAACHVHSEWSYDGSWSLEALRDAFSERGYRVLLMTEHDRGFTPQRFAEYKQSCAKASTEAMLIVPGIEYSDAANCVHVLAWGCEFIGESLPTSEMLEHVRAANGVTVWAHPSRREAWKKFDPYWNERLMGVEAWNRKYDGWAASRTAPDILQQGTTIPFVGLDFHTARQFFPLGMALEVEGKLTVESVFDSLRARRCQPRVFGMRLSHSLLRISMPALGVAEKGRKKAAAIIKKRGNAKAKAKAR